MWCKSLAICPQVVLAYNHQFQQCWKCSRIKRTGHSGFPLNFGRLEEPPVPFVVDPKEPEVIKGGIWVSSFFLKKNGRYDTTEHSLSLVSFRTAGMNSDNRIDDLRRGGGLSLVVITAQDGAKLGTVRPRPKKGGQIWRFPRGPHLWPLNNSSSLFFGLCLASAHFAAFARESHVLLRRRRPSKRSQLCRKACNFGASPASPQLFLYLCQLQSFAAHSPS